MSSIVLAIKPEYVERILKKQKHFEFRKKIPLQPVDTIIIYCTYPVMKIVASVKVLDLIQGSPTAVWNQTKHAAGISRTNYRKYFNGVKTAYAFSLGEITVFETPVDISRFGFKSAPQSFAYLPNAIE